MLLDMRASTLAHTEQVESLGDARLPRIGIGLVSLLALVPCFWQRRIEAGDLRSHLYNAWLVQLIERGRAPGLWVARQWNNVLFDFLVAGFGRMFGLHAGERIAVSLSVLIFFWGAFAFIFAANRRAPWFLVPVVAVIAYGWTFQEGVFNYYLSIGLAFFALAIIWRGRGWVWLGLIVLLPLTGLAHPLGLAWLAGGGLYIGVARLIPGRFQLLLILAAVAILIGAHLYLERRYKVVSPPHSVDFYNGLDQMILTRRYELPAVAFAAFVVIAVGIDLLGRWREQGLFAHFAIPLGLYVIAEAAVLLLPDGIYLPQYAAPLLDLLERLTLISAVLLCCLLGATRPRWQHLVAGTAIAIVFFTFLYQDTAKINHMEEQAENLVRTLPPGARILATVIPPLKYRFSAYHMVDRACIGRCFSWGNYEAPSGQFRIRAMPQNQFVMSDIRDASAAEEGTYLVRAQDLPAYQIYQCSQMWMELCLRPLQAGERNDRLGIHSGLQVTHSSLLRGGIPKKDDE